MKITKLSHSCLLVETPTKVALFDPGMMSEPFIDIDAMNRLDEIFITHQHGDHFMVSLVEKLYRKFPRVQVTAPKDVVMMLMEAGVPAKNDEHDGVVFFDAPHEPVEPLFITPPQIGYHYAQQLTHPGDSHTFSSTMPILALPITAPWGATVRAVKLALELKPTHVIPIHDWHWSEDARKMMYQGLSEAFGKEGIMFHAVESGEPFQIDV